MRLHALALIVALAAAGCGDTYFLPPTAPAPVAPAAPVVVPPVPVVVHHTIEFRVNGNPTSARIRYSNPVDGLTQVVTSLPYIVEGATAQTVFFLSLEVTPIAYPVLSPTPFLSVQIIVDGVLFREATSNDTTLTTLAASGTWRAN